MTVMRGRLVVRDDSDSIEGLLPPANFARLLDGENHQDASDLGFLTRRLTKARAGYLDPPGTMELQSSVISGARVARS